jgi:iron complex outermembrane receptor protein
MGVTSAHADSAAANVDEVIVTGARGRPRTVADSPSPIDVISAAQLQESGKVSLKEALAVALPSFNFGTVNGFAHNNVVRPVSMRGLGSAYTLVLVNGKRRHPTSLLSNSQLDTSGATPVDVDQIPISAVERIEVLRDGAAAQYGSDAIAGVINIILKSSPQGGSAVASAGRNFAGDGDTAQLSADWGAKVGAGSLHLALDAKYQNRTDRNDLATGAFYFPVNGQPDPREATDPRRADYNGNPVVRAVTLSANYETPVADATFYTFATGGARSGNARMTRRRPNANNNIPEIFPNGYIPVYYLDERDFEVVSGVRGAAVGWNWDLSTGYGRNHTDSRADTLNPSLGPASPTHFELYTLASGVWTTNLDARREVGIGLGSPLQLAGGLEYRRETYRVEAGDAASYVDGGYRYTSGPLAGQPALIGVQGVNAVDAGDAGRASRSNLAAYVDLGLDVTKAWYLGLAARAEHYDDSAGDTVSWKLTTRYAVTPTLAFRGTASTATASAATPPRSSRVSCSSSRPRWWASIHPWPPPWAPRR